jgi:hypothetical protein
MSNTELTTMQLNFAAAQYRLQREALSDCVDLLLKLKQRDKLRPNNSWWNNDSAENQTLFNAQQLLKPTGSELERKLENVT